MGVEGLFSLLNEISRQKRLYLEGQEDYSSLKREDLLLETKVSRLYGIDPSTPEERGMREEVLFTFVEYNLSILAKNILHLENRIHAARPSRNELARYEKDQISLKRNVARFLSHYRLNPVSTVRTVRLSRLLDAFSDCETLIGDRQGKIFKG